MPYFVGRAGSLYDVVAIERWMFVRSVGLSVDIDHFMFGLG